MVRQTQQVQCPNCHNYMVTKPNNGVFGCAAMFVFLLGGGWLFLGVMSGSAEAMLIALPLLAFVGLLYRLRQRDPWVCKSCGYRWKSSAQPGVS